jgi:chromosome segregation ATPase
MNGPAEQFRGGAMEKIEGLRKQLADENKKLQTLQETQRKFAERTAGIEKKRSLRIVAALTGNQEAQKTLQELNVQFDAAVRDELDAADAIQQVSQKIARLNAALSRAAKEQQREDARNLIQKRFAEKREQRIIDLVKALDKEISALNENNSEIDNSLKAVDESLALGREGLIILMSPFRPQLPFSRDEREVNETWVKFSTGRLKGSLAILDSFEIPGEAPAGEKDLAETAAT